MLQNLAENLSQSSAEKSSAEKSSAEKSSAEKIRCKLRPRKFVANYGRENFGRENSLQIMAEKISAEKLVRSLCVKNDCKMLLNTIGKIWKFFKIRTCSSSKMRSFNLIGMLLQISLKRLQPFEGMPRLIRTLLHWWKLDHVVRCSDVDGVLSQLNELKLTI